MIANFWHWLWRPSAKYSLGALLIAGGIGGVVFWGGFNTFMEYTNTLDFCISCHEMRDNSFAEYRETIHFTNASGVRVVCSDCHVPKAWTPKLLRKIHATRELFLHFAGTLDTPELFEEKRLEMAQRVWASMEASDSLECRNCHSYEAMDFHLQSRRAQGKMEDAADDGTSCIECHKGIAHLLPEGFDD